ncbi:MAG: cysteine desulfurase family protein [Actinomycetota bacterium]
MSRAYLDHASTAPLRPAARDAIVAALDAPAGDPGRIHAEGRAARVALEQAREQVAAFFGARPREVVFTGSGTEAVNAAVHGALTRTGGGRHAVTTAVEHSAVTEAIERSASVVTVVGVDRHGRFDPEEVIAAVRPDTGLVSLQLANHEVGTVQPIAGLAERIGSAGPLLHVDCRAAAGHLTVSFADLGVDLASVTAHTWGGPLGAGALLVRRGLRVPPLLLGGAQERARRGGAENGPAWIGFGAACAATDVAAEAAVQRRLIDAAAAVLHTVPGLTRYGDGSLPNLLCLGIDGVEAEPILLALDQHGVAVHSGSACSSETLEPSPVLAAIGVDADRSLRVSVGWSSTAADIARFTEVLPGIVERLRGLRTP